VIVWCNVHHAPFKDGVTRWCKKSNPGDTCEVDKSNLPPRMPPARVLLRLGSYADQPGFAQFLADAQAIGFGLAQPGDHDMDDERWAEVSDLRVRALIASFHRTREDAPEWSGVTTGNVSDNGGSDAS
jgi:hypothetical protein